MQKWKKVKLNLKNLMIFFLIIRLKKKSKQKLNDLGHNSELTYLPSVAATFAVLNISTSSHQNNDIIRIVELSREYLRLLLENSIGRHGLKH